VIGIAISIGHAHRVPNNKVSHTESNFDVAQRATGAEPFKAEVVIIENRYKGLA
jgi:hypothetical protein